MHISSFWTVAGLVILCTCGVGCSSVTSAEYTRGIIQSGRVFRHTELPLPPSDNASARVKVACFTESRKRHAGERHSLWLVYLPLACTATTWERSDWLLWGSDKGGYKPAGLDMAEAIRNELEVSGLFQRVMGPSDDDQAEWTVEGDIRNLTLRTYPHLLGCTVFAAPLIGSAGLPLGLWTAEQQVHIKISRASTRRVVWEQTFSTRASGPIAAYYGRYPEQFGYPYDELLKPLTADLIAQLNRLASNVQ